MSIKDFSLIEKFFSDGSLPEEKEQALYAELVFMVLSRATAADLNIEAVEVDAVIAKLKELTGEDVTAQEIRVAALSKLYKFEPFERYVAKLSKNLTTEHRQSIVNALVEIFWSDGGAGPLEADFFNLVAGAIGLSPAELVNLRR